MEFRRGGQQPHLRPGHPVHDPPAAASVTSTTASATASGVVISPMWVVPRALSAGSCFSPTKPTPAAKKSVGQVYSTRLTRFAWGWPVTCAPTSTGDRTGVIGDGGRDGIGYTLNPRGERSTTSISTTTRPFLTNTQTKLPLDMSTDDACESTPSATPSIHFGQGVPFYHMGTDILRSKSLDRNSYTSGDWFNRIDFTMQTHNWATGIPPRWE